VETILEKAYLYDKCGLTEKVDYCWVKLKDLLENIDNRNNRNNTLVPSYCNSNKPKIYKEMYDELNIDKSDTRKVLNSLLKRRLNSTD
jgi:hypothetical protein